MKKFIPFLMLSLLCGACVSTQEKESAQALKVAAAKPARGEAQTVESASKACPVQEPFKSELSETTWTPVFLKGQDKDPMPEGGADGIVYLRFDKSLKINGMSGNNLFAGSVVIGNNGSWRAFNLLSTRRMGPFDKYEYKFLQALHKADNIILTSGGKTLKLKNGNETLIEFKKIKHIQD